MFGCQKCWTLNLNYDDTVKGECGHPTAAHGLKYCVQCAILQLICQKCGADMDREDLAKALERTKIKADSVRLTERSFTFETESGLTFVAAARSGPGHGDWFDWTEVTINGRKIIDK